MQTPLTEPLCSLTPIRNHRHRRQHPLQGHHLRHQPRPRRLHRQTHRTGMTRAQLAPTQRTPTQRTSTQRTPTQRAANRRTTTPVLHQVLYLRKQRGRAAPPRLVPTIPVQPAAAPTVTSSTTGEPTTTFAQPRRLSSPERPQPVLQVPELPQAQQARELPHLMMRIRPTRSRPGRSARRCRRTMNQRSTSRLPIGTVAKIPNRLLKGHRRHLDSVPRTRR